MRFKTLVITIFLLAVMWIVPTTRGWLETLGDCIHDAFSPSEEVVVPDGGTGEENGGTTEGDNTGENGTIEDVEAISEGGAL